MISAQVLNNDVFHLSSRNAYVTFQMKNDRNKNLYIVYREMKPGGNLKDLLSAGEEEIRELFILTEDKMEEKGGRITMKNTNSRGKPVATL